MVCGLLWKKLVENYKNYNLKKAKIDALKLQINFRMKVLGQTHPDKTVFQFSVNHKQLSVDQLVKNLVILVSSGSCIPELSAKKLHADPELLIYHRVENQFNIDGELVWCKGTVLSYDKMSKEYSVVYDGEDCVFCFPLLDDLQKGELQVIS